MPNQAFIPGGAWLTPTGHADAGDDGADREDHRAVRFLRDVVGRRAGQKSIDALSFTNRDCSTEVGTSQLPFGMNAAL